ncbi:hypothetical protein [Staphylococcus equorum]|uniref:hypothetical protein n=1 Tax=Staphylococcus equorum TaxID=246432 RepID=UPI000807391F|nr:hypothetical protein [Staphylococcus equorum]ANR67885.1 hypothetical protein AWC34_04705 [Staphylococcus equorum]
MTDDPKKAYNHFAHLNDFLKKEDDYRHPSHSDDKNEWLANTSEANIYKKSKSSIKQKGHIK